MVHGFGRAPAVVDDARWVHRYGLAVRAALMDLGVTGSAWVAPDASLQLRPSRSRVVNDLQDATPRARGNVHPCGRSRWPLAS